MNRPPALAKQLDRCDVCGDKVHRDQLVMTQVEFLQLKAENYFNYSSYDTNWWTMDDAVDAGSISYGNRCDNARTTLSDANVISYLNGVQTWTGNGTLREIAANGTYSSSGYVTMSAQVGPHEQNTSPEMTVNLGICNSDGSVKQIVKTYTISGTTQVWFYESVATLNGYGLGPGDGEFYFYIEVTNAGNWWIDELQIEFNVNTLPRSSQGYPENFVRTSGASVFSSSHPEQGAITARKVCPNCQETVLKKTEKFGRTDEPPVADPVSTWNQEF